MGLADRPSLIRDERPEGSLVSHDWAPFVNIRTSPTQSIALRTGNIHWMEFDSEKQTLMVRFATHTAWFRGRCLDVIHRELLLHRCREIVVHQEDRDTGEVGVPFVTYADIQMRPGLDSGSDGGLAP